MLCLFDLWRTGDRVAEVSHRVMHAHVTAHHLKFWIPRIGGIFLAGNTLHVLLHIVAGRIKCCLWDSPRRGQLQALLSVSPGLDLCTFSLCRY